MSYLALYRKFRPETFDEVRGQEAVVTTLRNQLRADRLGHAYLFCGTRGTGKTSVAKILARAVNCENLTDGNPCGTCPMCQRILAGNSMNVIEIDAASNNGVDNVRDIREEVAYSPVQDRYKVYIIDEVHMLSGAAFNALLKTLEEPPSYVIFILATTEAQKIPATILSRCQRYDFHRMSIRTITERMQELLRTEGVEAEEKALRFIARMGDGSMRDSLSLLDRCISFYLGEALTYERVLDVLGAVDVDIFSRLYGRILSSDVTGCIRMLDELVMSGRELSQFTTDFIWYLRNVLLVQTSDNARDALDVSAENYRLLEEDAKKADEQTLMRYIRILSDLSGQLRYATQKRVLTEVALIRLCRPQMEIGLDSVLDRLRVLEERVANAPAASAAQPAGQDHPPVKMAAASPAPRKAAPEDLQKIAAGWRAVTGRIRNGVFRKSLESAIPKFGENEGAGTLFVVFQDFLGKNYTEDPVWRDELREAIRQTSGTDVDVRFMVEGEQSRPDLEVISVDERIQEMIRFPVETVPDEE